MSRQPWLKHAQLSPEQDSIRKRSKFDHSHRQRCHQGAPRGYRGQQFFRAVGFCVAKEFSGYRPARFSSLVPVVEARRRSPSEAAVGGLPTVGGIRGIEGRPMEGRWKAMEGAIEGAIAPRWNGDGRAMEGDRTLRIYRDASVISLLKIQTAIWFCRFRPKFSRLS